MRKIILASKSPRRKALLKNIGLKFAVEVSDVKEKIDVNINPRKIAENLSLEKARKIAIKHRNALIIAADTFVVYKNKIIGKPKTEKNARKMLKLLSGEQHLVITGFTIIDTKSGKTVTKSDETKVYLKKMTRDEIDAYIKTKEPLDKAGAYAAQEKGGLFVEKIEGDFLNVVGLPIFKLTSELKKFNVKIL